MSKQVVVSIPSDAEGQAAVAQRREQLQSLDPQVRRTARRYLVAQAVETGVADGLNEHLELSYMLKDSSSREDIDFCQSALGKGALSVTGKNKFGKRISTDQLERLRSEVTRKVDGVEFTAPLFHFLLRSAEDKFDARNAAKLENKAPAKPKTPAAKVADVVLAMLRKGADQTEIELTLKAGMTMGWETYVKDQAEVEAKKKAA